MECDHCRRHRRLRACIRSSHFCRSHWPVGFVGRRGTSGGTSASVAGENIIAYDLDRLFRGERRPQGVDASISYPRSEAARILLTTSSHRGMQAEDRAYLLRLVTAMTGLAPPDAERRVAEVIARAQENIARARATVVILGFMRSRCRVVCLLRGRTSARRSRDVAPLVGLESGRLIRSSAPGKRRATPRALEQPYHDRHVHQIPSETVQKCRPVGAGEIENQA